MYDFSDSESRVLEASRFVAIVRDPGMEVRTYYHGFHLRITKNKKRE